MAFDKPTRNRLAAFVAEARRLITDEFTQQFQSLYGISDASLTELSQLTHLDDAGLAVAGLLRERIDYLVKTHPADKAGPKAAVDRLAREQAFTVLNRLAAVRMAEKRGLIAESVGNGYQSKGFKVFEQVARSGLGEIYQRYRRYLFCLFDELAIDLGVLFDRRSPQGLLFPRENTLLDLLNLLNAPELEPLWQEDETIGWIYQYYNDPAERKKMREESAAPRNSRELAVRNQFFTPRYVVEFLTDNTLGRIWYEMTRGETQLKEQCRYLVRRPNEIFLGPGETAPIALEQEGLSQEELLRQPVHIPHRAFKDPRQLRMLDPACGSMHFGLYAFDLYEVIYEEAWDRGMESLHADFPDRETLLHEIPRLIIEHNIHGIDIDPRAVQIAGLSLWLRAQRSWQQQRLPAQQRPQIRRSNIVCAEPMPGNKAMLHEFIASQFAPEEQPAFTFLLERVFDRMALAGEAGSLLKIEEEISEAVREAKGLWKKGPQYRPGYLFAEVMPKKPEQLRLDLSGISDEGFWETAEERIYAALRSYAEQAESGGYQRRLFAEDAARGFAFIDICRKRYDSTLMNPPFGEATLAARSYIGDSFPESKEDIYAAFVSRGARMLVHGVLGVISNRTGFFLTGMRRWRESTLLDSPSLSLFADLGDGVLDGALVEAAAYTLQEKVEACTFFRLLNQADKALPLFQFTKELSNGLIAHGTFINHIKAFQSFPELRISYWAPPSVRQIYGNLKSASGNGLDVKFGLSTKDDWRFIRLRWEIPDNTLVAKQEDATPQSPWMYIAKGGEYSLHFADIHLVANWANKGNEIAARVVQRYPYLNGDANWVLHLEVPYGRPGVTYTKRTTSGFSPRLLPPGCLISDLGCTIYADDDNNLPRVLAAYGSRAFGYLLEFNVASGDSVHSGSAARHYEIGTIASVPVPDITALPLKAGTDSIATWRRKAKIDSRYETGRYFILPFSIFSRADLHDIALTTRTNDIEGFIRILDEASESENSIRQLYGFDKAAVQACEAEFGPDVTSYPRILSNKNQQLLIKLWNMSISDVVADTSTELGFARFISKMTFLSDRRLELICHRLNTHPRFIADALRHFPGTENEVIEVAQTALSYALGVIFGRWDIRYFTGERPTPDLPDPFAPLPVCPPGMLQSEDGLPLSPESGRQLRAAGQYPLDIAWDGILVDDPGHPLDVEYHIRETFTVLWDDRAEAIEQEACELLGVKSLRDYFRKPSGFFADHLKRYSKSRRQAPIYWPLSTAKGSYTLWIYYHRLSDQTLHTALADFVDPKIKDVRAEISLLRESNNNRGRLEELLDLEGELLDFQAEIERIIKLPWQPNLNDGVLITAAPLWRLFRLPKWQKDLKACWDKLEKGEYDWAHLTYSIWPKRVEEVCKKDRSIAIAHGLEHLCQVEPPKPKAKRGRKKAE